MGAVLCCIRPPSVKHDESEDESQYYAPAISSRKQEVKSANKTLEDCLRNSPFLGPHNHSGGSEIQIFKHSQRKICPNSSPEENQDCFFTPRMSFPSERFGAIDKTYELCGENLPVNSISRRTSGKLVKRVTFKLPEEADIYKYSTPKETFEE